MHQHDRIQHHFNSHPHEEDDPLPRLYIHRSVISTHILTKRMTLSTTPNIFLYLYFNSHPLEEDDDVLVKFDGCRIYFNSHPHEEDDSVGMEANPTIGTFQLTSSRRG